MADREKAIKGLEWILADDRFGFGINWETGEPRDDYEKAGKIISDTIALLKEHEPKTGKWILDDDDANSWECSECGGLLMINDGTPHENDWHFCPYCGAKLDKQVVKWE